MSRSIEEHLAEFVLGMQRGPEWRRYVRKCLVFWESHYGKKTAEKVRSIINGRKGEKK